MRLPRMTTRRWMIAVAIVAWLIEAEQTRERWSYCVGRARHHAILVNAYRRIRDIDRARISAAQFQSIAPVFDRLEAENLARQRKYERAARHPWLPVEPDPPDPN